MYEIKVLIDSLEIVTFMNVDIKTAIQRRLQSLRNSLSLRDSLVSEKQIFPKVKKRENIDKL